MGRTVDNAYLIFDAAANPDLIESLGQAGCQPVSLFEGTPYKDSKLYGPFLAINPPAAWFAAAWKHLEACKLLVFASAQPAKQVADAWKALICSKLENGEHILLRAYDPAALGVLLPTCDEKQLNQVFAHWARLYAVGLPGGLLAIERTQLGVAETAVELEVVKGLFPEQAGGPEAVAKRSWFRW